MNMDERKAMNMLRRKGYLVVPKNQFKEAKLMLRKLLFFLRDAEQVSVAETELENVNDFTPDISRKQMVVFTKIMADVYLPAQISKQTGFRTSQVLRQLKKLIAKGLVTQKENGEYVLSIDESDAKVVLEKNSGKLVEKDI